MVAFRAAHATRTCDETQHRIVLDTRDRARKVRTKQSQALLSGP